MCWRTTWCPPLHYGPAPPLRPDCAAADDGYDYEELPVSLPPHVPRGLSRDGDAPSAGGEAAATSFAVEQAVAPASNAGFGVGGAAWLAWVCASSVYAKVAAGGPSQS